MMNSMVLERQTNIRGRIVREHHLCPACVPNYKELKEECKETIPIFASFKEAKEAGWVFTKHISYCKPGQEFAAICPECAKEEEWVNANRS